MFPALRRAGPGGNLWALPGGAGWPRRPTGDNRGRPGRLVRRPPFTEAVHRLAAYRGVTRLGALTVASEVGDWRRFPRAAAFTGFCGLVPSEYSSGASTRRGHITKCGNAHLRAQLVESAWAYQHRPGVGLQLRSRQQDLDPQVVARAWAAQLRLRLLLPPPGRPQGLQGTGRHGHRPRAGRLLVGRDDHLTCHNPTATAGWHQDGRQPHPAPGRRRCRTDPRPGNYATAPPPRG